jgi:OmpA-like transmembrane domain
MPTPDSSLKTLLLAVLVAAAGVALAQGDDQWYGGQRTGFWGLNSSVGVRGALPGMFNPPGSNSDSLNALRQYGGYRITNAFAIEGSQTQFGSSSSGCNGDAAGDPSHPCYGSAWALSGVATLPLQSGLSLYGKLGLHYWQKGAQDDSSAHHNTDEPGAFGKVYGVGLSYGLTKSITVHAESERYSELIGNSASGNNSGVGLDSSVHSIGLSIKF